MSLPPSTHFWTLPSLHSRRQDPFLTTVVSLVLLVSRMSSKIPQTENEVYSTLRKPRKTSLLIDLIRT